jgi:hypothetical protein
VFHQSLRAAAFVHAGTEMRSVVAVIAMAFAGVCGGRCNAAQGENYDRKCSR